MTIPRKAPLHPRSGSRTRVVGHRGDPSRYPHNSIAGILAAGDYASMAEIDVRPSRDRQLVLSHDHTQSGLVIADHDWTQLSEVELGNGHRLGLLADLMSQAGEFPLNIEIKNWPDEPGFDPTSDFAIEAAGYARDIDLITCFHWPTMHAIRRAHPSVRTGLLVTARGDVEAARDEARLHGHVALALHQVLISEDPTRVMTEIGDLDVVVWTVNDHDLAIRLADAGVFALITDDPAAMVQALGAHEPNNNQSPGRLVQESAGHHPSAPNHKEPPMSIESELDTELKDALRSKDRSRLDVVRQIRTEVAKAATEPGASEQDRESLHERVIGAYVKKMDKARREYETYGERGAEMAAKLRFETDYLSRWLPDVASNDEIATIVAEAIATVGATDVKQSGQVIGHIMKHHHDVDGGTVNQAVRTALGG